ncbi:ABC transporter substrate-binding protein [Endozoicomonas montiporae]|nr:ABC transporter substrate-binding protein [Endozoicomonas montiporae]
MPYVLVPLLLSFKLLAAPVPNKDTIHLSLLPFFSSAAVFIAKEKGCFREENLDVEFIHAGAAQNVALSVASGEADIGVTALTAGFYNLAGKGELKIIAGQYQEKKGWPGSTFLACNTAYEKGLTSPEMTIHHSMGITQTGSTFHRWFGAMADRQGETLDNNLLIRLQTVPAMIAALNSCQVDSITMMSQVAYKLSSENKAHIIGRVSDYSPGQMGIVFASPRSIKNQPDKIQRFLNAYKKASQIYFDTLITGDNNNEKQALLSRINQYLTPKLPENLLPEAVVYLDRSARPDIPSMQENLNWYQQQGLVNKKYNLDEMLALELLNNPDKIPVTNGKLP